MGNFLTFNECEECFIANIRISKTLWRGKPACTSIYFIELCRTFVMSENEEETDGSSAGLKNPEKIARGFSSCQET